MEIFNFFPLELFDIIVLRVRIKRKLELCDSGGHRLASISGKYASFISSRLES